MDTCNIHIKLAPSIMDIHQNHLIKIQQNMFNAQRSPTSWHLQSTQKFTKNT